MHKLVLVTPGYDDGWPDPGLLVGLDDLRPEMQHGSPFHGDA